MIPEDTHRIIHCLTTHRIPEETQLADKREELSTVSHGALQYMVWHGMVWYGMVGYGMVIIMIIIKKKKK